LDGEEKKYYEVGDWLMFLFLIERGISVDELTDKVIVLGDEMLLASSSTCRICYWLMGFSEGCGDPFV
jgi:hypothetical protein